jgi:hypothetical protein
MMEQKVRIELSQDEVVVPFKWLHRMKRRPSGRVEVQDQAEQRVAWISRPP